MGSTGVQTVFELAELAQAMFRQRLRRDEPDLDEAEINDRVTAWLLARPGAPVGDAIGPERPLFETTT